MNNCLSMVGPVQLTDTSRPKACRIKSGPPPRVIWNLLLHFSPYEECYPGQRPAPGLSLRDQIEASSEFIESEQVRAQRYSVQPGSSITSSEPGPSESYKRKRDDSGEKGVESEPKRNRGT